MLGVSDEAKPLPGPGANLPTLSQVHYYFTWMELDGT